MPTATKDAESLFFDYGLELDEDVRAVDTQIVLFRLHLTQSISTDKHNRAERPTTQTENRSTSEQVCQGTARAPSNYADACLHRYDLLCFEGLVRALRLYLQRDPLPAYKIVPPATGAEERWVEVQKEVH